MAPPVKLSGTHKKSKHAKASAVALVPEKPVEKLNEIVGSPEMPFSFYEISDKDTLYLEARSKDGSSLGRDYSLLSRRLFDENVWRTSLMH